MKFGALFGRRQRRDQDLDEEVRAHLAMAIHERIEQGEDPSEAEANARHEFGNATLVKEVTRDMWGWKWLETLLQDLRYGLRQLRRNPGFAAAAIAIAALGIAATCVVFSFADAAVFRALPYKSVSRLVAIGMTDLKDNLKDNPNWSGVSVPVFLNWREHAKTIGQFAVSRSFPGKTLVGGAEPEQVFDYAVSEGAFRLLGVRPAFGRNFVASDDRTSGSRAVILSYPLWQSLFDGRPDVVGRSVTLDGVGHTIVGIMPPGFLTPDTSAWEHNCWTPLAFNVKQRSDIRNRSLTVWARLKPGVSPEHSQATLSVLALRVMKEAGRVKSSDWRIKVTPLRQRAIEHWRSILILLLGAVGFLLAIACANVANLLLARAHARQKEIAVRTAIGASRARIVRQLLTESVILSAIAGALGILLARWGIELERQLLPQRLRTANFQQMGIDLRILGATLAISVVVGIAFGLAPALYASKVDLVESLKEGAGSANPRRKLWNGQSVLVVAEVALSLTLLMGAGLMLRSFLKLEGVNAGLNPQEVLTLRVLFPKYRYPKPDDQIAAYRELLRKIKPLPGVQASGFVTPLPLAGINATIEMPVQPGMVNVRKTGTLFTGFHAVSPGYFKAMGIPLLRGRTFTAQDTRHSEGVFIVDKAFVDRYWPGEDPLGKELFPAYPKPTPVVRVVGEVGRVRDLALGKKPRPELYEPFTQKFFAAFAGTLVAKTRTPASTAVAMEKAIHSVDPDAPISQIETMRQVLSRNVAENRLYAVLVGVFASLALLLAAAGIASTVSYTVSRQKHEVGIRMALGARRSEILFLIVRQVLGSVIAGIALGAIGSLVLTRFVANQLYGVSPTDPLTFLGVSALLAIVSMFASIIPATKATSIDPAETLRAP